MRAAKSFFFKDRIAVARDFCLLSQSSNRDDLSTGNRALACVSMRLDEKHPLSFPYSTHTQLFGYLHNTSVLTRPKIYPKRDRKYLLIELKKGVHSRFETYAVVRMNIQCGLASLDHNEFSIFELFQDCSKIKSDLWFFSWFLLSSESIICCSSKVPLIING